jgi:hypothetical protein
VNTTPLKQQYPDLFYVALNSLASVQQFSETDNLQEIFHRPLSTQAFGQFQQVQLTLTYITLTPSQDIWRYCWNSATFSAAKLYRVLIQGEMAHPIFKKIWKSAVIQIYKIFCWFLIQDRLNTRSLLLRKSFHLPTYQCVLCNEQIEETTFTSFWTGHLLCNAGTWSSLIRRGTHLSFRKSCWLWMNSQMEWPWTLSLLVAGIFGCKGTTRSLSIFIRSPHHGSCYSRKI